MEKNLYYTETISSRIKFGNHIKKLRVMNHITQDTLAERTDLSTRNISDLENGKINTSYSTIYLIAKAFGITMSELLNFEE